MPRKKIRISYVLVLAISLSAFGAARYHLTDLGDLPGGSDSSQATAINNAGQIVGKSQTADGWRAFLWQNGQMINLGTLYPDDLESNAYDINNSGVIVGRSTGSDGWSRAFRSTGGPMEEIWVSNSPNSEYIMGSAEHIDDSGRIAGEIHISNDIRYPILRQSDGTWDRTTVLGTLFDATDEPYIFDLGDASHVTGSIKTQRGTRAFISVGGQMTELEVLPG